MATFKQNMALVKAKHDRAAASLRLFRARASGETQAVNRAQSAMTAVTHRLMRLEMEARNAQSG